MKDTFFLTGDFHGAEEGEQHYLTNKFIRHKADLAHVNYEDIKYCVILGDAGFLWKNDPPTSREGYWTRWFDSKPFITLCLPGNHENYEDIYLQENLLPASDPVRKDLGGEEVYKVSSKVYYLKRGCVYNICGRKALVLGGAESIDRSSRKTFIDWFPQEAWGCKEIYDVLDKLPMKVDIVLSHTCPQGVLSLVKNIKYKMNDSVSKLNEEIRQKVDTGLWYFGHFHYTGSFTFGNVKYTCLYKDIDFPFIDNEPEKV